MNNQFKIYIQRGTKVFKNLFSSQYTHFIILGIVLWFLQTQDFEISTIRAIGSLMIYSIIALGFYILLGFSGLASLGTAGFVGLGTYITGYLLKNTQIPFGIVLLIVISVGIILGVVVGFISLRIEGMYLAIITLGLSEILVQLFKNLDTITGGVNGFSIYSTDIFLLNWSPFPFEIDRTSSYYVIVILFIGILFLSKNLTKSPTGRAMLAMKNSESAAQSFGVSILRYRLLAFVIATVFAMIAGFLYMIYFRFTLPTNWNLGLSLNILAVVVIGGTKSIWGLLMGAFLIFGLNDIMLVKIDFFAENPTIVVLINGLLMVLVVMFYPGGISQLILEITNKIKYRKRGKLNVKK
jgi:branched-chain amino acid transport system permease protein